jgi:arylsulfatase A-like enzyme
LTIDAHLSPELAEHDAYKAYLREQGYGDVADESQLPEEHYRTRWTARESAGFIRSDDPRPFFLFCSFVKPHPPYDPPEPYASLYADAGLPAPVAREEEFTTRPLFVRARMDRDLLADTGRLHDMKARFYGLVTMLDSAIGDVVDALNDSRKLDNTIVVFTSDHGEFLGDHYLRNKTLFYEASAAIPLIVAGPRVLRGHVSPALTGHVDLLPTLLDFAGIELPSRREGESLRPILTSQDTVDWREAMFGELVVQLRVPSEGVWCNNLKMVTTDRHKYCYYSRVLDGEGTEEELFDLHNDPNEFDNVAGTADGGQVCRGMRDRLLEWLARAEEHRLFPLDDRYPYSTYLRESGKIVVVSPESKRRTQGQEGDRLPF